MKSYLKNIIFLVVALIFLPATVYADEASFIVSAPQKVYKGDSFHITYILKNGGLNAQPSFGKLDGIKTLFGPSISVSQYESTINGRQTRSEVMEFAFTVKADNPGTYTFAGASVTVKGKTLKSGSFTIKVMDETNPRNKANAQQSNTNSMPNGVTSQDNVAEITKNDVFIRVHLSKSSAYENEAVVCTVKLYSLYDVSSILSNSVPTFDGFLIEKLKTAPSFSDTENINGKEYSVAELDKYIIYPQHSGKITINSGKYDVNVVQYRKQFSRFGGYGLIPIDNQITVSPNTATLNVIPLPDPKPASFTGAVGNFKISGSLNTNKFRTYDAATYKLIITGTGNIKYIKAPQINFPAQFETYDPQVDITANPSGGNMTGKVECLYTFVPAYVGQYEIPPVEFSYFDIESKTYKTISTSELHLNVEKGNSSQANVTEDRKEIMLKNKDILTIKHGNLNLEKDNSFYLDSWTYWMFYVVPLLLLIAIAYIYRRTIRERADITFMRVKKAGKVARKRLRIAKKYLEAHDSSNFYAEILKAIWGYLSDKLSIPVSQLNKENIATELHDFGASQELSDEVIRILDECEFAQYAPEQTDETMEKIYNDTASVMNQLQNIKQAKKK